MAAVSPNHVKKHNKNFRNVRAEMQKLRDSGLSYISSNGLVVSAKTQPKSFCHCPKQCKARMSSESWKRVFDQFYGLADQNLQNMFLQSHIIIKTVHVHNWETEKTVTPNKRRVTCKYHIPDIASNDNIINYLDKQAPNTVEVCQKAFMNVFCLTEKRIRMQRERNIADIAPDYYTNKAHKEERKSQKQEGTKENVPDLIPMSELKKTLPAKEHTKEESEEDESDGPLDLSSRSDSHVNGFDIDKSKLYEIADLMGVPRDSIDKEMEKKYEEMVLKNLEKQQKLSKSKKNGLLQKISSLRGISEQVLGLEDDLTILPIQTLNNGDLTITPVLGSIAQAVENQDIMRVNSFFQNQLWRPEYIGLTSSNKLQKLLESGGDYKYL